MTNIGKKERETQSRVVALSHDELKYRYLGNWEEREDNSNLGVEILTAWLIDWKSPLENDFAVAEEVAIKGIHNKRPDIVLCVNGIALGGAVTQTKHRFHIRGYRNHILHQRKSHLPNLYENRRRKFGSRLSKH